MNERARDLALAVAEHLPGWTLAPEEFEHQHFAKLHRADGAAVSIFVGDVSYGWTPKGRVLFAGSFPKFKDGTSYHGDPPTRITCSATRSPKALADEVRRRLLPAYEKAYAEAAARVAKYDAAADEVDLVASRITSALGGAHRGVRRRVSDAVTIYPSIESAYRVRVEPAYSDKPVGVSLELHRVRPEIALEILHRLQAEEGAGVDVRPRVSAVAEPTIIEEVEEETPIVRVGVIGR